MTTIAPDRSDSNTLTLTEPTLDEALAIPQPYSERLADGTWRMHPTATYATIDLDHLAWIAQRYERAWREQAGTPAFVYYRWRAAAKALTYRRARG